MYTKWVMTRIWPERSAALLCWQHPYSNVRPTCFSNSSEVIRPTVGCPHRPSILPVPIFLNMCSLAYMPHISHQYTVYNGAHNGLPIQTCNVGYRVSSGLRAQSLPTVIPQRPRKGTVYLLASNSMRNIIKIKTKSQSCLICLKVLYFSSEIVM